MANKHDTFKRGGKRMGFRLDGDMCRKLSLSLSLADLLSPGLCLDF